LKVLVTGAGGFIGSAVVEALLKEGCYVIACARNHKNISYSERVECQSVDLGDMLSMEQWIPFLDKVDAVVNCAGILNESKSGEYRKIHYDMPRALVEACVECEVQKFIQVSALGDAENSRFIQTKFEFDNYLIALPLEATVIRPSVVVSLRGSYGGSSLLRAMAVIPFFLFLPGNGEQRIQPILLEDLGTLIVKVFTRKQFKNQVIYAVGPSIMTIKRYLSQIRYWLKIPPPFFVHIPMLLVHLVALVGQALGHGPLGKTALNMLLKGNVAPADAYDKAADYTGFEPRSVEVALENSASFVQDRWHARLYFLKPLLWFSLALVWVVSGVAGLLAEPETFRSVLEHSPIQPQYYKVSAYLFSLFDILLGVLLFVRFKVNWVVLLMFMSTLGYTLSISAWFPGVWLDPLGGMLKNLPLLVILPIYWVLEDMR